MSCFRTAALLAALFLSAAPGAETATDDPSKNRPNVILFLAEDFGAGDLATAGHPYVKSPNLDVFSQQALTIYNAYAAGTFMRGPSTPVAASIATSRSTRTNQASPPS